MNTAERFDGLSRSIIRASLSVSHFVQLMDQAVETELGRRRKVREEQKRRADHLRAEVEVEWRKEQGLVG